MSTQIAGARPLLQEVHEHALLGFSLLTGVQLAYAAFTWNVVVLKEAGKSLLTTVVLAVLHEMVWGEMRESPEIQEEEIEVVQGPPELRNSGTTCWLNTALQWLRASPYREPLYAAAQKERGYYAAWEKFECAVLEMEVTPWTAAEVQGVMICLARYPGWKKELVGLPDVFKQLLERFDQAFNSDKLWPQIKEADVAMFRAHLGVFTRGNAQRLHPVGPVLEFLELQKVLRPHDEKIIRKFTEKCKVWEQEAGKSPNLEPLFQAYHRHGQAFSALQTFFGPGSQSIDGEKVRPLLPQCCIGQQDVEEFVRVITTSILRSPEYPELFFTVEVHRKLQAPDGAESSTMNVEHTNSLELEVPSEKVAAQMLFDTWNTWTTPPASYELEKSIITEEKRVLKALPQPLMIHIKRFKFDEKENERIKLVTAVEFTEEVSIQGERYQVVAVAYHTGEIDQGHYTALVCEKGRWWYCNDTVIAEATAEQKKQALSEGYLYSLKKVKTDGGAAG